MIKDLNDTLGLSSEKAIDIYKTMVRIRQFEDSVYLMFLEGKLPGTVHLYQGQEAVAAGVCANLRLEDVILSTHRPHGHAIAKGVSIKACMAELFGKITGCCKGKGGSMHLGDASVGMIPAIAITGGGIPIATGCALAFKYQKKDNVAVSFFGDGASNEGTFHEGINMGALWNLPVIYVCENNYYGASTHISKVMKIGDVAQRAPGYGIPGVVVDGNDVTQVYEVVKKAVERARAGEGPTLIECKTWRRGGHSRGDANQYRDKEEEKKWLLKDPILLFQNKLVKLGIISDTEIDTIQNEIKKEIDEAIVYASNENNPDPRDCNSDVWSQ